MAFYHDGRNVENYIDMAKSYDGRSLIQELGKHLKKGSTVLELGMGPGKDLQILSEDYVVTGTDESEIFVDLYKNNHPNANVFTLDAIKMDIDETFDCIYSNKVLMHLSTDDMVKSINLQRKNLKKDGLLFHSLWRGKGVEEYDGLVFVYYEEEDIRELFGSDFEILEIGIYTEAEENDSLYFVLK